MPDEKLGAIRRLGFGVLNKVVLLFPTVFWDHTQDSFGHVDASGGCAEFPVVLTLGYVGVQHHHLTWMGSWIGGCVVPRWPWALECVRSPGPG